MRIRDKKALPIGLSDFKSIIEENYYYVDKTDLISNLLYDGAKVNLFTRPRRFGKTLNMSMLKHFFDIENGAENRKLFENLKISDSKYMTEQGKYPVIFISFKNLEEEDWKNCLRKIKNLIGDLYNEFEFLRKKLNKRDLKFFDSIWMEEEDVVWESALKNLTRYLYNYYGERKVIVLIDEYDTPIIQSYQEGYYKKAILFFKNFYGDALKDNSYLQYGVMTGILRIAKEGIFSGLNNLKVDTIFNERYSDFFGLTEKEVTKAVRYYELEYEMEEVKKWYDGYQFGSSEIYNPWSIINFLSAKQLRPYWIGVSGNKLIDEMLDNGNKELFDDLGKLFNKEKVYKQINDYSEFTFDINDIWQLFLYSGYLTTDGEKQKKEYPLRIPNKEILDFFENRFIARFIRETQKFTDIIKNLKKGKIAEFAKGLQDEILSSLSYFDTDKDEKYYKVFLIGIFIVLGDDYIRLSEREAGYGRADLVLEPKNKENPAYIFEFKTTENESELESYANEGFEQIKVKEYDVELKIRGVKEIIYIGLAFYRKMLKMKYEKVEF
jgi:hypothetical protein